MKTTYLGLELSSPVVVGSSPYTASRRNIEQCARHGAGAVVLKSIFEEQILRHATAFDATQGAHGDAGEYLERYLEESYKSEHLQLVADACRVDIPVIASINCVAVSDSWMEYAAAMEQAGASALELNIFMLPTDRRTTAAQLERAYADIVRKVAVTVTIPVSVKLPMRFTNILSVGDSMLAHGACGVVLFNRFFEPDIDVETMSFTRATPFSRPEELRNVLRTAALCSTALPQLYLAVSTGVHGGESAVKAMLCGAHAVQICSAIHEQGYGVIGDINRFIDNWADRHGFESADAFRGRMDYGSACDDSYQRNQYMRYFPHDPE